MQNKGVVKFFAIIFAIVCIFQLSFTFISYRYDNKAESFAHTPEVMEEAKRLSMGDPILQDYLYDSISAARMEYFNDSLANESVFNILIKKYSLKDVKEREINLGLDLKGGMNVTMEVSVPEIIRALSGNSQDPVFNQSLILALEKEKTSTADFVDIFAESFNETDPNAKLASIFSTMELKDRINYNSTNEEVIQVIRDEVNAAIDRTFNILRVRIDRFGVTQPNINRLQTARRILIELPGIKEPDRVRKLLQGTAQLEFWETYQYPELYSYFADANQKLADLAAGQVQPDTLEEAAVVQETTIQGEPGEQPSITEVTDPTETGSAEAIDTTQDNILLQQLEQDTSAASQITQDQSFEDYAVQNPLFAYLNPAVFPNEEGQYVPGQTAMVGRAFIKDTARVNSLLKKAYTMNIFPRDLKLAWIIKPRSETPDVLELVALKVTSRDGSPALSGEVVTDARQDYDENGRVEVTMNMNAEGARIWKRITGDNIGKQIAIVLDGYVRSYPNVNQEIPNGMSSISGGEMTVEEALDLANILKAGKLPAPARIVQEEVVGPSLGRESIRSGLLSFIIAFVIVLLYMSVYYNRAGNVADIALFANVFFLFGVMASIGAVLTLPGIAGIVLTLAMAVDSNVIIFERMREEIRAGKGMRLVVKDGFRHAYSAIIDSHVTTILTGIVLYVFGSGPVQGFATTLVIGLLLSLFTAVFLARLLFEGMLDKNMTITVGNKYTLNAFANLNFDFIKPRRKMYVVSAVVITIGLVFIGLRGLDPGLDFTGGRSYVVRFDNNVSTKDLRESLRQQFGESPEVKTFGPMNQVKITTKFLIDDRSILADSIVGITLFEGVKGFYTNEITYDEYKSNLPGKIIGELSSQRIDPAISYALIWQAVFAVGFSLIIIFIYIAVRFKNWQYGLGGVVALFHDTLIIMGMFAIFHGILPFNMEVDQSFIAAILTVIGYSIMDSVIIFDRIREYNTLYPKRDLGVNINGAINSTLGRTVNTSGTTILTLVVIFIFGGEVLRGFTFAMLIGVMVGTYSSIYVATPVAYDVISWRKRIRESKIKAKSKKRK